MPKPKYSAHLYPQRSFRTRTKITIIHLLKNPFPGRCHLQGEAAGAEGVGREPFRQRKQIQVQEALYTGKSFIKSST